MKEKLSKAGFALFAVAVLGMGIGQVSHCPDGSYAETNLTFGALYALVGFDVCRP